MVSLPDLHTVDFLSLVTFYLALNAIFSGRSDLTTMSSKTVSSLFLKTKNKQTKTLVYADQCISLSVPPLRMPTPGGLGPFFILQLSES